MVKIVHTSDVHLGSYRKDTDVNHRFAEVQRERSFAGVMQLALSEKADLLLIAGDFFDSNRVPEATIAYAIAELKRLNSPVIILPGNHDSLGPDSVYTRYDLSRECSNVYVLKDQRGELVNLPGLDLSIWGKPHYLYGDFRPLTGLPPRTSARWNIAMAHGYLVRSDHDLYHAWTVTESDIAVADRDYVALGHWDIAGMHRVNGTVACYSGAPVQVSTDPDYLSGCAIVLTLDEQVGQLVQARQVSSGLVNGSVPIPSISITASREHI